MDRFTNGEIAALLEAIDLAQTLARVNGDGADGELASAKAKLQAQREAQK